MTDQIDDDAVRAMLRSKAAEVRVSDDAWTKISARLQEAPARPVGRRLALAGAAAAAVAGTVFVANLPGSPTAQVATPDTTTSVPAESGIAPSSLDPVVVATEWLRERVPDADLVAGELQGSEDGDATVAFREGEVQTEVFLRQRSGREGWAVVAAASDLIPLFDPSFVDGVFSAEATAESAGTVEVFYAAGDVREYDEPVDATPRQSIPLRWELPGPTATAWITLRTPDGVVGLSAVTVDETDPAVATGSYVAVWPATDSAGLADLQRQVDDGERTDLLDPDDVARAFLVEALGADTFGIQAFQRGDNTSGEVPYALADGADGTVMLRRAGGEGTVWYVIGATSSSLELFDSRREETHLIADVRSTMDGTLTWTGATPVDIRSGQIVSIGRPDTPVGSYPVVVRLVQDGRTVALAAGLS